MNPPCYFLAVLLIAGAAHQSLLAAWQDSPYVRWGWVPFFPCLISCLRSAKLRTILPPGACHLAVFLSVAGILLEIHALTHVALAIALTGLYPAGHRLWLWLVAALSWIPATGYAAARCGLEPDAVSAARLVAAGWIFVSLCWLPPRAFAKAEVIHV